MLSCEKVLPVCAWLVFNKTGLFLHKPVHTWVRTAAIPMRQEATPRKRNFLEMAALLELCGVRSGGRVITILMEFSRRKRSKPAGALDTDMLLVR